MQAICRSGVSSGPESLIRALHGFLADNKQKLSRDEDDLIAGPRSLALERYREERAAMARLVRLEREGELVPRDLVRQSIIKSFGNAPPPSRHRTL